MSAPTVPFLILYTQTAFTSLPFITAFIPLLLWTGAWWPILIAFIIAFAIHILFYSFANQLSTPTAREAVIITGCSSGLGEAAALHLASVGYTVFATFREDVDAQALVRKAGRLSERVVPVLLDITQQQSVDAALAEVSRRLASDRLSLRVLIHNAGGIVAGGFGGLEVVSAEVLQQSYALNLTGSVRVTQAFLPLLRATAARGERARIAFTSSVAGQLSTPYLGSYGCAKAALECAADCLRMELRSSGIEVCIVEPGNMATPGTANTMEHASPSIADMTAAHPHVDRTLLTKYERLHKTFLQKQQSLPQQPLSYVSTAHEHIVRARWVQERYVAGWDAMLGVNVLRRLPELARDYTMLVSTVGFNRG